MQDTELHAPQGDTAQGPPLAPQADPARPYADLWDRPGYIVRRLHQVHMGLFAEECAETGRPGAIAPTSGRFAR